MASTTTVAQQGSIGKNPEWFGTTHWSMVLAAQGRESGAAPRDWVERCCLIGLRNGIGLAQGGHHVRPRSV
jgi:hypothetical protein